MKKNMKIIATIVVSFLIVISNFGTISALSGQVTPGGTYNILVGETLYLDIVLSSSENDSTFELNVSVNGSSAQVSGETHFIKDEPGKAGTLTVKGVSEGVTTISLSGTNMSTNPPFDDSPISNTVTINVSKPAPSKPSPSKPGPSSPSPAPKPSAPAESGGSNSGETVEKTDEEIEAEKKDEEERIEAEKKEKEEKEKEEAKNTPLVENFDIISTSEKMFDLVLETINTENGKFNYEYTLPKNIDSFKLSFTKISDDVNLEFEEAHELKDGKNSISIPVKASKGDISQEFTIVVKKNESPIVKRTVNNKELTVFDDDGLISYMEKFGFKKETFKVNDKDSFYFIKDGVKLQLLIDEEYKGGWYLLNDKNEIDKEVIALEVKDNLFFVVDAPEELQKNTLNGAKYAEKSFDFLPIYKDFHPSLTMSSKYKAWEAEDGQIVYGFTSDQDEGLFFIKDSKDKELMSIEKAFVGFDQVDGKMKNVAVGSSVALFGLIPANVIYYVVNKKKENALV